MSDKILITGATGFIGSHLVDYLIKEGVPQKNLSLLARKTSSLKNISHHKNLNIVYGDLRNKESIARAMEGVSTIYHLASLIRFKGKTDDDYVKTNVYGTANLLAACKKKAIKKFVFFSSIAVYGLPAFRGNIKNCGESHPFTYSEIYGQTKYEGEKLVKIAHKSFGLPYVIIRPVSVYGPRDTGQLFGLFKAIKNNQFFFIGDGRNKMHFIYVADLVKAALKAQKERKAINDYIIGSESIISLKQCVNDIASSIGKTVPNIMVPKNIGLPLSYIAEAAGKIVGIKSPLFPERVRVMTTTYYYNITKMQKDLRFSPKTSFREGAKITGKWYKENKWI